MGERKVRIHTSVKRISEDKKNRYAVGNAAPSNRHIYPTIFFFSEGFDDRYDRYLKIIIIWTILFDPVFIWYRNHDTYTKGSSLLVTSAFNMFRYCSPVRRLTISILSSSRPLSYKYVSNSCKSVNIEHVFSTPRRV